MCTMASQITSLTIVYSTVHSGAVSKKTSKLRATGLFFSFHDVIIWWGIHEWWREVCSLYHLSSLICHIEEIYPLLMIYRFGPYLIVCHLIQVQQIDTPVDPSWSTTPHLRNRWLFSRYLGAKMLQPSDSIFLPPPRTLWCSHRTKRHTHVVSL